MNNKGTILKLKKNRAIAFTDSCDFVMIKRRAGMFVGQQISIKRSDIINPANSILKYTSSIAVGIAALFIIMFSYLHINTINNTYAYVDLDINPSLELAIDSEDTVLQTKPLNDDASAVTKGLKLEGSTTANALFDILSRSAQLNFINRQQENFLLISASLNPRNKAYKNNIEKEETNMRRFLGSYKKEITRGNYNITVITIQVSPEIRKQAVKNEISMGRQFIYNKARENNIRITIEEIRNMNIFKLLKIVQIETDLSDSEPVSGSVREDDLTTGRTHKPESTNDINTQEPDSADEATTEPVQTSTPTPSNRTTRESEKTNESLTEYDTTETTTSEIDRTIESEDSLTSRPDGNFTTESDDNSTTGSGDSSTTEPDNRTTTEPQTGDRNTSEPDNTNQRNPEQEPDENTSQGLRFDVTVEEPDISESDIQRITIEGTYVIYTVRLEGYEYLPENTETPRIDFYTGSRLVNELPDTYISTIILSRDGIGSFRFYQKSGIYVGGAAWVNAPDESRIYSNTVYYNVEQQEVQETQR